MQSVFHDLHHTVPGALGEPQGQHRTAAAQQPHVVFVVNNAAFFESHRLPVAKAALRAGYAVSLCTGFEASATLAKEALPRLARSGVQHWRLEFRSGGINPLRELWGFVQLVQRLRALKPSVVHCASPKGVLYGGMAARLAGVPSVVLAISGMGYAFTAEAANGTATPWRRVLRKAAQLVLGGANRLAFGHPNKTVIVQNEDDRQAVFAKGWARPEDVQLIPGSGVDLVHFATPATAAREPIVLLPARLLKDKGVLEFAAAAQALRAVAPGWRFVLVGTADYDNPSAVPLAQIEQWQAQGTLEWWGHVDATDMPGLYAQASIVCLPSYREGMPRVLLEAAAAGCAVVTADAVGCRDAIAPGLTGDLVPVGDAKALAATLLALMRDPERCQRYGQQGAERAARLFDLKAVIANTLRIYSDLQGQSVKTSNRPAPGKRLLLLQLNEVCLHTAGRYTARLELPHFSKLLAGHCISTTAEKTYDELEPWIQWPSVYTGLTAAEHGINRLGDAVGHHAPQVFEVLEQRGVRVGCVATFNAENRMQAPAYFVPDPWTATASDGSFWSRELGAAVAQMVNDNAQGRATLRSLVTLAAGVLRFARPRHYAQYLRLAATARGAPWRKALFLDLLLHDVHWQLLHSRSADFSSVFFNAGAHIQHHYLRNAKALTIDGPRNPANYISPDADPVAEMLQFYDRLLGELHALPNLEVITATGLGQVPYPRTKYYWRLREHSRFLGELGVPFKRVRPRMSRDFLIECDSAEAAKKVAQQLGALTVMPSGQRLFGVVDNRGDSLFVTLTFPDDVTAEHWVCGAQGAEPLPLAPAVALVALKNGMHRSEGHAAFTAGIEHLAPSTGSHVKALHGSILAFFGVQQQSIASNAEAAAQSLAAAPATV
jgi:hypothetical protein